MTAIYLDKDFGAMGNILSAGGRYITLQNGVPTGFNPFAIESNDNNKRSLQILMKILVTANGETLKTSEEKELTNAINFIMDYIGIDIGSTASKVVVKGDHDIHFVLPTGWSSKETCQTIKDRLLEDSVDVLSDDSKVVATGYGRVAVDFADHVITEITCHARGGREMAGDECAIIDVGGQDTKIILVSGGMVQDFQMNDKCSAGTGKFLEIMANRLGVTLQELFDMADKGTVLPISSLCTVFAESEVINYIGEGQKREDIAAGVVDSVANKVAQLAMKKNLPEKVILTGGLSNSTYFTKILSQKLGQTVSPTEHGRYAGALGAALLAKEKKKR